HVVARDVHPAVAGLGTGTGEQAAVVAGEDAVEDARDRELELLERVLAEVAWLVDRRRRRHDASASVAITMRSSWVGVTRGARTVRTTRSTMSSTSTPS